MQNKHSAVLQVNHSPPNIWQIPYVLKLLDLFCLTYLFGSYYYYFTNSRSIVQAFKTLIILTFSPALTA